MSGIPVWMDCDTGMDDAVAIMLAHALSEINLIAISTVCGNAELDKTYWNTQRINRLINADYPVYRGAEKPLMKPLAPAVNVHGENGLGGVELPLPEDVIVPDVPAWDALYACARSMPGELRLVATAPMTNIATAFIRYPDLPGLLHSVTFMGGSAGSGNVTPAAEFNFYTDPEAAQIVLQSGAKLVMCGLDVTNQAYYSMEQLESMAATGSRAGMFVRDCGRYAWSVFGKLGMAGFSMHDSCPVMYLAHPELFEGKMAGMAVETRGTVTNGKSVTDLYSDKQFPFKNVLVLLKVDRDRFISILTDCVLGIR